MNVRYRVESIEAERVELQVLLSGKLVENGGDRDRRAAQTVSGPTHRRARGVGIGDHYMAAATQRQRRQN